MSTSTTRSRDRRDAISLTRILRHTATSRSLPITPDGYIPVTHILALPQFRHHTATTMYEICENDPKNRFSLLRTTNNDEDGEDGVEGLLIRANYGHSMGIVDTRLMLDMVGEDENMLVVHGTSYGAWEKILKEGMLRSMKRNCVHFVDVERIREGWWGNGSGNGVGPRKGSDVWIYLWTGRGNGRKVRFYSMGNGVVVVPGNVGKEYWEYVCDKHTGRVVWERDADRQRERQKKVVDALQGLLRASVPVQRSTEI